MMRGAIIGASSYIPNMPKKMAQPVNRAPQPDWFLKEWMAALKMSQSALASECDWTRGTMHGIYHGRTAYYRDMLNLVASKLRIQPYELLMHPDEAMALRRMRQEAIRVVEAGAALEARHDRTGTDG